MTSKINPPMEAEAKVPEERSEVAGSAAASTSDLNAPEREDGEVKDSVEGEVYASVEDISVEKLLSKDPIIDPETGKLMAKRKRKRMIRWKKNLAERPEKRRLLKVRRRLRKQEEKRKREERDRVMLAEGKITAEDIKQRKEKQREKERLRNRSR